MKSMFSKLRWATVALAAILCFATSVVVVTPAASAETYTIKMGSDNGNLAFQPALIKVKHGDVVQWLNNKLPPHNVMFDATKVPAEEKPKVASLSHGQLMIKPGENYELAISSELVSGEYSYYCAPHRGAGMAGKIIVED
jgi:plastocyanin